ncbi:aspartate carbamoyltransferase regulatory subunit [Clostridium sp. HCP1S3_B4]|uniref:aspartate carbamoyltransferase regulatory subunit n=1 Tax=unclassified Clostridium TaxID=2614128 RepID=UPI0016A445F5|nr:aspartate carbamoyltransferase regulatory subunit [Clostridiales bacterium]MDY2729165.1 aspartate carbamoyltransferase regulatory subunit [Clostridium sp.]NLK23995.1 aspartate carbamoyltransferase regulatory subunit [Clostridiales bacterium]
MLEITSLKNGLVIDHIEAGAGVKIFKYLNLDKNNERAALIINAESKQYGRKDIIKFEKEDTSDVDYTILALMSPRITIDEVKDGKIVNKVKPQLPEKVENILICKNPRCITIDEKYVPHSFILMDREKGTYRCEYCDTITRLADN